MKRLIEYLVGAALIAAASSALYAAPTPAHVRGTIQSVSTKSIIVDSSAGPVKIILAPPLTVTDALPSSTSQIRSNAFIGVTSVVQPNGSQRAVEVHIFPASMRGAGEGTRPWDFPGASGHGSKMTNGTLSRVGGAPHSRMTNGSISAGAPGSTLTVSYKQGGATGDQKIIVPTGIPVVLLAPGSVADLRPGAAVFVMAVRKPDGTLSASRVLVGKNGAKPPM